MAVERLEALVDAAAERRKRGHEVTAGDGLELLGAALQAGDAIAGMLSDLVPRAELVLHALELTLEAFGGDLEAVLGKGDDG